MAGITLITFVYIAIRYLARKPFRNVTYKNAFFCRVIVVIFDSMLDVSIRRLPCKSFHNYQMTLTLQTPHAYYNLQIPQHLCKLM